MRALLSVANRDGIADLARELQSRFTWSLFTTEGTRAALAAEGIESHPVSDLTGSEALAGGQVKTFHPSVYGGHPRPPPGCPASSRSSPSTASS